MNYKSLHLTSLQLSEASSASIQKHASSCIPLLDNIFMRPD